MAKSSNAVASAPEPYKEPVDRKSGWSEYDIRDSLRTLSQADKIRKNKPLMAAIKAEAVKQLAAAKATASTLQGGK